MNLRIGRKTLKNLSILCLCKAYGDRKRKEKVVSYYYCNRSGAPKEQTPQDKRKRHLKSQGSCKSGNKCVAFLVANRNSLSGGVEVDYCLDHVGHKVEHQHLKMSEQMRDSIATKLAQGLTVEKIMSGIRESFTELDRDTMVDKQDIYNISKQFNISSVIKDSNDATSVPCSG